jgi:hypothetical protein
VAIRIRPDERSTATGQNADMERSIAISAERVGAIGLYSSEVTTAPGARSRIHHDGDGETSIWIASGRARYTFGPTGLEESMEAEAARSPMPSATADGSAAPSWTTMMFTLRSWSGCSFAAGARARTRRRASFMPPGSAPRTTSPGGASGRLRPLTDSSDRPFSPEGRCAGCTRRPSVPGCTGKFGRVIASSATWHRLPALSGPERPKSCNERNG